MRGSGAKTRIVVWTLALSLVTSTGLYHSVRDVPPPMTLYRLATGLPSETVSLFPAASIAPAPEPLMWRTARRGLPPTVSWRGGRLPTGEFLARTQTTALLVVRHGEIVHEWYRAGIERTTLLPSYSVAKSVISLLVGRAIERGRLRESDRLVDVVPELRSGTRYDEITIAHLLDMRGGVDVEENTDPWNPMTGTARMYLTDDLPTFLRDHRALRFRPGDRSDYRSIDSALLGLALARAESRPITELVEDLWHAIGAESAATWNLDRVGGVEKSFCCLNATARDFARIGSLILSGGRVGSRQLITPEWIRRTRTPVTTIGDWGYAAQWWQPARDTTEVSAVGINGQFIYVHPATETVIVKLSDNDNYELDNLEAIRSLVG